MQFRGRKIEPSFPLWTEYIRVYVYKFSDASPRRVFSTIPHWSNVSKNPLDPFKERRSLPPLLQTPFNAYSLPPLNYCPFVCLVLIRFYSPLVTKWSLSLCFYFTLVLLLLILRLLAPLFRISSTPSWCLVPSYNFVSSLPISLRSLRSCVFPHSFLPTQIPVFPVWKPY